MGFTLTYVTCVLGLANDSPWFNNVRRTRRPSRTPTTAPGLKFGMSLHIVHMWLRSYLPIGTPITR